jgi:4-azaleucine resistance transporter AzlC
MSVSNHSTPHSEFLAGARSVLPLILGSIPFGLIFGASALAVGLSPAATIGMSLFVFAGSSQFIGVNLIGQGASAVLIIFTTFIVNARHALYSASLAPYLGHLPQRWLLPLAFFLTDEAFAVTIGRFESDAGKSEHRHWYMLGAELAMFVDWQLCTVLGIIVGSQLENANLGLDFAMSVTFIGIVVPLIRTRPMLISAVVAGVTALAFDGLPNKLGLMIAAAGAITAGYIAESMLESARKADHTEARV